MDNLATDFTKAVVGLIPSEVGGLKVRGVDAPEKPELQDAAIVGVYFVERFPLSGDWMGAKEEVRKIAVHISASSREMRNADDVSALAKRKVDEAFDIDRLRACAPDFFGAPDLVKAD
jgi:hypothetical protein